MKATFYNESTKSEMLVSFSNELVIGEDGWAQIAPFGDFPGMGLVPDGKGGWITKRAIQRVDKQAVEQMVEEHNRSRRGLKKFLNGRPIFNGHPDNPVTGWKYPDKTAKGVFANVAVRENGFYGEPILTDEGEELVATKKVRAFSSRWETDFVGEEMINGKLTPVFRPTRFLSAGMTDKPNLPVEMFNEQETNQTQTMKKETVIAVLASLGILTAKGTTFANDASDEDVSEGLKQLGEKAKTATTLASEKATFANEKAQLEGQIATLKTEKATAATERETARTQFANERAAHITDLLDGATQDGRVTAAERPTWENRLKNEAQFANEAEALKKLTPKTKTASVTLQRGDRKVEISNSAERRDMVTALVNEKMVALKCGHDAALATVRKECPQLFEGMREPRIQMPGSKRRA